MLILIISLKNALGVFIGIVLNVYINLWKINIFKILTFPIWLSFKCLLVNFYSFYCISPAWFLSLYLEILLLPL